MSQASPLQTGDWLKNKGLISKGQLDLCLRAQSSLPNLGGHSKVGELLLNYGFAHRTDIESAVSSTGRIADGLGGIEFPLPLLRRLKAFPIALHEGTLRVAAANTLDDTDKYDLLTAATDIGLIATNIEVVPKDRMEVLKSIHSYSSPDQTVVTAELNDLTDRLDDSAFITQVIQHVYVDALQSRASDIHIMVSNDPAYSWLVHRIDGVLRFTYMVSPEAMGVIATRIKSDAGIDFSDTMRPHDGRTSIRFNGKQVDIRVSTLPVDYGEKIVLRLLDSSATPNIARLFALHPSVSHHIKQIVETKQKTGGIVLVTGATGSGKSTTLNAMLNGMDRSQLAIGTVEDPVELRVPLVGHTQVNEASGLTYVKVLRALLRQDPDIIMVGELRDRDTVAIALQAAETGHLMLSTLHTDNVPESVNRLLGMMDESFRTIGRYIIAGSLKGVVNQKLAPRLCVKCMHSHEPDSDTVKMLSNVIGVENLPTSYHISTGCTRCNQTGYHGRVIVPEALFIGSSHETRAQIEDILLSGQSFRKVLTLSGVTWYPRAEAVAALLREKTIDLEKAFDLLDIRRGVAAL